MTTPFDRALETRELTAAADAYALRHGQPGSLAYRAAWMRFRHRINTIDDLRRWRSGRHLGGRSVLQVLDPAVERAIRIDGAAMANAQLYDPQLPGLRLVAQRGCSAEFCEFFEIVDDIVTACGRALANGSPVWVSDITRSAVFAGTRELEVILRAGSRAVASLPVSSPTGRVIAMISIHHARPTQWTDRRKLALERLSQSTGRLLHHLTATNVGASA